MQDKFVQAIRYKLQKRVRRLNSVNHHHFPTALKLFFSFFENSPLLAAVRDELLARPANDDLQGKVERLMKGERIFGGSEEEAAAIGYLLLKKIADDPQRFNVTRFNVTLHVGSTDLNDRLDGFREAFLEPFYEYVDEHIDDQQAILYFLRRYKHRCEWFESDRLRRAVEEDTQKAERSLASDLYAYLHAQGIDFHIEPRSASGIPDLVADQVGDDRVVADAKILWPERDKGKPYLIRAFNQVYTYACDYNVPCAYLVIFKMCKEDVNFLIPASDSCFHACR